MTTTERDRNDLLMAFEEVFGEHRATALRDMLPPVDWGELATKADLQQLRLATKTDLDLLRGDVRIGIAELELRVERSVRENLRTSLFAQLGYTTALVAALLAAVKL